MDHGTLRILLDTCVWGGVYQKLLELGYDVVWTGLWQSDPGDEEILHYAYREQRVLFTLDKDFGELAMLFNTPHCGIVRLVNLSGPQQLKLCLSVLNNYRTELQAGSLITVEPGRIRIRSVIR